MRYFPAYYARLTPALKKQLIGFSKRQLITGMLVRMLKLRMLNAIAPAYFYTATAVTFVLHFFFFIPTIFQTPESANENVIPVCSPDCPDRVDAHYLFNGRHFCKLLLGVAYLTVEYSISFENPLTFLTLLPISTGYFFLGAISGLQFFLVLMLYVWLGVGLVSAGFCCQQVLLVARGQTWCQLQKGQLVESRGTWRSNLSDVFGSHWVMGLFLPVQTVETIPGNWQRYHEHKHD